MCDLGLVDVGNDVLNAGIGAGGEAKDAKQKDKHILGEEPNPSAEA